MFVINEEIVSDVKSMAAQSPGQYARFVEWLNRNFDEINTSLVHMDPSEHDVNFDKRFHYRRGFLASVDALRHFLATPDQVLPEGKTEEVIPESNAF
jgi:hypothetical protein